jgi:hypothetical protein
MSKLLILLAFCISFLGDAYAVVNNSRSYEMVDTVTISYIRKTFYSSVEDEKQTEKLIDYLRSLSNNKIELLSPLLLGYYGAAETLIGKHAFNPYTKLSKLNSGLEYIARAIKLNPNDLEIRFLRFSILHYIPGFLGYSSERDEDMKLIISLLLKKNYSELNYSIQRGIVEFMIESDRLNSRQLAQVEKLLVQ